MKVFLGILILYLLVCIVLFFLQEKFIFYPEKLDTSYPFDEFPDAEELFFEPTEGTKIHALHFKTQAPKSIVLYFHGNARALDDWGHRANHITKWGCDVFMADYRGFGKSKGKISEEAFHNDALFLYKYLTRNYNACDIILYGCSLGSGVATKLAGKVNAKLLILETPYMSLQAVAQTKMPFLPVSYLLKYKFRNDLNIKKVNCPIHIFHGTDDELIPYSQAVSLAALAGGANVLTTIPSGTHNNLSTFQSYHTKLGELLKN